MRPAIGRPWGDHRHLAPRPGEGVTVARLCLAALLRAQESGVTRMNSAGLVPDEGGTPELSLASLGKNLNLDDVIVKGLIKEKIASLDKFRVRIIFFHAGAFSL